MINFDSGPFVRSWKHGGFDNDPAWTNAEKAAINTAVATIVAAIPTFKAEVGLAQMRSVQVHHLTVQDPVYSNRWTKWQARLAKTADLFVQMQRDLGTGGKTITLRKAADIPPASEIMALCEFSGDTPRWVISVNGNANDPKCHFFAKANASEQAATLFHEMSHLYGTEDTADALVTNNAHRLERIMGSRGQTTMRTLLAEMRQYTMLGDSHRIGDQPMSKSRLAAIYGPDNCWDKAEFEKEFTGDPLSSVTRVSDGKTGIISIVWDAQDRPLYFYDFR